MSIFYEDECCSCATPGYPCLGDLCPKRHAKHLYCDRCGDDVEELYEFECQQICTSCLIEQLDKFE